VTALLGLFYNASSLFAAYAGAFDRMPGKVNLPYFEFAFFVMSSICVSCYLVMIVCAIDLLRLRLRTGQLLAFVLVFEVGYFFAVGSMWREPTVGSSIAAATGIANGGLMAQFLILFPVWGPTAMWASGLLQPSVGDVRDKPDEAG